MPIVNLPADFASSTLATTGQLVGDLSPILVVTIGVMLAVLAVGALITFVHPHK